MKIEKSNTPEPDQPQHARAVACVIAQQYSSYTFVSLHAFQNVIVSVITFKVSVVPQIA